MKSQIEVFKSIRKPLPPPGRIEQPVKGSPYSRKQKFKKWADEALQGKLN